ncbi:MAG: hypothetical protein R3C11_11350 [Planctomycetaceae bacterium]
MRGESLSLTQRVSVGFVRKYLLILGINKLKNIREEAFVFNSMRDILRKEFTAMRKVQLQLDDMSEIKHEYNLYVDDDEQFEVLVVAFKGAYQYGSAGNGDGRFMAAMVSAGLMAWRPSALVLDFSDLEYEFGNTIMDAIDAGYDQDNGWWLTPTRILVSRKSLAGMTSLMEFCHRSPTEWLFNDLNEVISRLKELVEED